MRHLRSRPAGDRGAAAVEFALLFPIFMVLAMGTIATGLAFSKQINATQAAREASRYGATVPLVPTGAAGVPAWLGKVDTAVRAAAGDPTSPIAGYDYRCVSYVVTNAAGTGIDAARSGRMENGLVTMGARCDRVAASTIPQVPSTAFAQVLVARDHQFFVLFANPTLTLDAVSATPHEGPLS